jgi:hypothetical protein
MGARGKSPAEEQLKRLDDVYGKDTFFAHSRMVITVARDLTGVMKVAHKLQSKVHGCFGAVCEVFMEHVKQEMWMKLHETTSSMGMTKGPEVPDVQVTFIPEGIRVHPYKREHLPTLEALLLWEDSYGVTKGHCLYSISHPDLPSIEQVDEIFGAIEPWFAKRWLIIELRLARPMKLGFDEAVPDDTAAHDPFVGGGVDVTVLACHPYGFARDVHVAQVADVRQCLPLAFTGVTDDSGRSRICFLPAEMNKIQIAETDRFHGTEVVLQRPNMSKLEDGPTTLTVELTPKALTSTIVHVFAMPAKLPSSEETDGIIDWSSEARDGLENAAVTLTPLNEGASTIRLTHICDGTFVATGAAIPEGCVSISIECPGYLSEERTVMLLVGANAFYVPMREGGLGSNMF